jgi:hypothetical protein
MSPETNGDTTLTTSYGWRIRKSANGAVEWRCPPCWQKFKAAQKAANPLTTTTPPPTPRGDRGQEGKGE